MMLESFLILLLFSAPLIAAIISTSVRLEEMWRRRLRFTFYISDILMATFVVGGAVAILINADFVLAAKIALIIGSLIGVLAGKIWYLSSITKTFACSAAYLFVGAILWSVAAIGPASALAFFTNLRFC
jgi:hypothetical protein